MIEQASAPYLAEVRTKWALGQTALFERDGQHPTFPFGGHDIKNNPKLQATLHTMAEAYIPLCARKAELFDMDKANDEKLMGPGGANEDMDALLAEGHKITVELKELDARLLKQNLQSFKMLLEKDSGLEEELARAGKLGAVVDKAFKRHVTKELVGATIKSIVMCCKEHIHTMERVKEFVPHNRGTR